MYNFEVTQKLIKRAIKFHAVCKKKFQMHTCSVQQKVTSVLLMNTRESVGLTQDMSLHLCDDFCYFV